MKHARKLTVGLLALCALALLSGPAQAQTTAAGPYYATPSWDQKLQCDTQATCPRFIVLSNWNSDAVLDRETGLVWEKSPDGTHTQAWDTGAAAFVCAEKTVGGRRGWRLPSINELMSLVDPSASNPSLPAGHPFTNVQSSAYWSATTNAVSPSLAWVVSLSNGAVANFSKAAFHYLWCVRGGGVLENY
jgi:hypothetical protein